MKIRLFNALKRFLTMWNFIGFCLVVAPALVPTLRQAGLADAGAIVGITAVVCSLFGELPAGFAWTQRFGDALYGGIALGVIVLASLYIFPGTSHAESSLLAWAPSMWGAYLSIVLATLSFRFSSLPVWLYAWCRQLRQPPHVLVPLFVLIAGLAGNILDGVSIISIGTIIFLGLLERRWAVRASFALLFGGLISNLITVAAEPTNIKFDESLHTLLGQVHPYYWFTNWPISVLGIILPAAVLAYLMRRAQVSWHYDSTSPEAIATSIDPYKPESTLTSRYEVLLSTSAIGLLGVGVILHAIFSAVNLFHFSWPLWLMLAPAGLLSVINVFGLYQERAASAHIRAELPVWTKLMVIFSLLWLMLHIFSQEPSLASGFFILPFALQYTLLIVLSLLSAVTDNVALASMQASIITQHPMAIWQIRLLFIVLTWAGGLTAFGCLQSLALNSHLKLSMRAWLTEVPLWAATSLGGGLVGLLLVKLLYATAF